VLGLLTYGVNVLSYRGKKTTDILLVISVFWLVCHAPDTSRHFKWRVCQST